MRQVCLSVCLSVLQEQTVHCCWIYCTLQKRPMGCLVTSLIIYQSTPCNILEKQRLRIQSGRSLTSHMEVIDHVYTLFNFSLYAFIQYVLSCRTASFICISYKCKARVRHIFISPKIPEQHIGQGNSKTIPVQAQRFPEV